MTRLSHPELAEHVATYAAERGDTELEQLCDDVLAGLTEEALLLAVVSGDPELQGAVERGRNAGWRSRCGVQDAFERATMAITGRPYAEVVAETAPAPTAEPMSFSAVLRSPELGRLVKDSLDARPGSAAERICASGARSRAMESCCASRTSGRNDMQNTVPRLFRIDTADLVEVTAPGTGIPRRKPRATAGELRAIRVQLENGPCMAAFQAGVHGIVDATSKTRVRIQLVQTDDEDAVPGLRP